MVAMAIKATEVVEAGMTEMIDRDDQILTNEEAVVQETIADPRSSNNNHIDLPPGTIGIGVMTDATNGAGSAPVIGTDDAVPVAKVILPG